MATDFIREKVALDWATSEYVQHSSGVLKTNAICFMDRGGQAFYPIVSLLSHSCVANLELVRDPAASIIFRAKTKIKKREELTIRYTDFLDSRQNIQRKTQREWMFTCQCARCSDPTELGSNFSSFQCSCGGFYHEYDRGTDCMAWRCSHCSEKRDLEEKYKEAENWIKKLDDDETVKDVLKAVESDGYYDNFYVTTKCLMKYVQDNT